MANPLAPWPIVVAGVELVSWCLGAVLDVYTTDNIYSIAGPAATPGFHVTREVEGDTMVLSTTNSVLSWLAQQTSPDNIHLISVFSRAFGAARGRAVTLYRCDDRNTRDPYTGTPCHRLAIQAAHTGQRLFRRAQRRRREQRLRVANELAMLPPFYNHRGQQVFPGGYAYLQRAQAYDSPFEYDEMSRIV